MQKALLVFGGNGFVGSAICRYAVSQGIKVTSVSRSGAPKTKDKWTSQIEYVKGDAMDVTSYQHLIPEVSAVVHSVGVLIDSKIKNWSSQYEGSYEHMSRDTALTVLSVLHNQKKPFVFISAERGISVLPRYISSKREVESYLAEHKDALPHSVLRPGVMYSDENYATKVLGMMIDVAHWPDFIAKRAGLDWVSENLIPAKSLPVDMVGKVAVLSAFDKELLGRTLNVQDIAEVSQNSPDLK